MKNLLLLLSLTAAFTAGLRAEGGEYACNPEYLGPTNVVAKRDGSTVYVVFRDASQIVKIDTGKREIVKKFDVPPTVTAMILSHDETKILFTSARPTARRS